MINLSGDKRATCSGCTACAGRCPVNCITMHKDRMGFVYPITDEEKCIHCDLCNRICPGLREQQIKSSTDIEMYAVVGLESDVRSASSSGGVFSLIAKHIISRGGIVFGAAFDDKFHAVNHIAVDTVEDLYKLQGSKYVQSSINSAYKEAKIYLEQGRMVLFSGTPCQIAGFRAFFDKDYENLILQDIVCHGVPAPAVWDEYIGYLEKTYCGKAAKVSFRDKRRGWRDYVLAIAFDNGNEYVAKRTDDMYMKGFLRNYYLRPSCYQCNHKGTKRVSDITLGDLWGAEKLCPELDDDKGTSLVMISSPKGKKLFDKVTTNLRYKSVDKEFTVLHNQSMIMSASHFGQYNDFENEFQKKPIHKLLSKYCSVSVLRRIKRIIKYWIGCVRC